MSAITGTTTQVYDAIDDLSATNSSFDVTITDTATADQIATIHEAIGSEGTLTATNVSELSGTPTALLTAVSYFDDIPTAEFVELTVSGDSNATQITDLKDLNYINTPFDGSQLNSIDGTATQVKAALDALTVDPTDFTSSITDTIVETDLAAVNEATTGDITLANSIKSQALEGSALIIKQALTGISQYTGPVTFTNESTTAENINSVSSLTSGDLLGAALRTVSGDADDLITALGHLKSDSKPTILTSVSITNVAAASDVATLLAYDYIEAIDGSGVTAITGDVDDVVDAIDDLDNLPNTGYDVTISGDVTTTQLASIRTAMKADNTLTATDVDSVTGSAATIITTVNDIDNKPATFNAILSDGEVANLDQLSSIDELNGDGTITANISTTAAALFTFLDENTDSDIDDLLSQASNIVITSYSGQDLSGLSAVSGSTTFELVLTGETSLSHANAASLNSIDKITVSGDDIALTLSGESFQVSNNINTTHFGSLSAIETTGSGNTVAVADFDGSGSTIDLKQLTTVSGFSSFSVTGDSGANIIQLSVALSTSGTTTVDLVDDDAVDRIIFNTDPDEDSNNYKSSGSNLGYTTVSNFDATDDFDKFGLYYGDTSAFTSYKNASKTSDGVVAVTQDSIILEEDNSPVYSAGTAGFDTVDEIKSMIAGTITSVSSSSDKIAYIQYGHDQSNSQTDTYIIAAELEGSQGSSNLESDDSFTVLPIARLLEVGGAEMNAITIPIRHPSPTGFPDILLLPFL